MAIASQAKPLEAAGEVKIIAWAGDVVPYQLTAVFAASGMIKDHPDTLQRFARAYQRGVADYPRGVPAAGREGRADQRREDASR